jgi:hypothetical protein
MKQKFLRSVMFALLMAPGLFAANTYTPPPESAGGWRWCKTPEDVRSLGGMDPEKLDLIRDKFLQLFAGPWQIVIIRHGRVVWRSDDADHHI